MKRFAFTLATLLVLCPALGWAQNNGADAFAAQDFARAEELWQQEAAAGSAQAMLGLGVLADRGYGGSRDFEKAFAWYSKAADLGLAEAQFNIAIMYDAGLGRQRDAAQALTWYTRAALRGHARAQYNLGLLFETGDGVVANPEFATYWFEKAAPKVPAAEEKALIAGTAADALASPDLSFAQTTAEGAELVWQAAPAQSQTYLVEMLDVPMPQQDYSEPILSRLTVGSGYLDNQAPALDRVLWRVNNISTDATDYLPSNWVGSDDVVPPKGRITLMVDGNIPAMTQAAAIFAQDLRQAGYWVRVEEDIQAQFDGLYIGYGFTSDQGIAETVARYLPSSAETLPIKQVLNSTQPGEIFVNFAAQTK